jgi:hypothetical protein
MEDVARQDWVIGLKKLKSFCSSKEMVSKLKRHPQSGRKYLPTIHQTKD